MKKLKIEISKAQLTNFSVQFNEDGTPKVMTTIALLTEENKHITYCMISTDSYNYDTKFDLPIEMITPIQKIAQVLENVVIDHRRDSQLKYGCYVWYK